MTSNDADAITILLRELIEDSCYSDTQMQRDHAEIPALMINRTFIAAALVVPHLSEIMKTLVGAVSQGVSAVVSIFRKENS